MPRALLLAILLSLLALPAGHAAARDVRFNDGPALGLALGADAGGIGGFAAYYVTFEGSRFGLMPHAGIGWPGTAHAGPGLSIGLGGSFGRSHRLVLDLQLSTQGSQDLTLYGERLATHSIYGLGLVAGWEWLSKSGFFMRANIGPAFAFLPPLYQRSEAWTVTLNLLSMGVKLW